MKNFIILMLSISNTVYAQQVSAMRRSLVKIFVHKQEMDEHEPWKSGRVLTEEHTGTVVGFNNNTEKGILVKGSSLSFAKRIEMQTITGGTRVELTPRFIDHEMNLAILEAPASDALEHLKPILVSNQELSIEEEVYLFKIDGDSMISRVRSSLREVNTGERFDTSSYPTVNYIFKVPRKDLGASEPVISRGRVVGLAVAEDDEDNIHVIPSSLIYHFLNDDLGDNYKGFPTAGISYIHLTSPYAREALGLDGTKDGVLINKVSPQSPFYGKIQENDLLLEINGKRISSKGTFSHPVWGELSASTILYHHYAGDEVEIEVLRNKKLETIKGILKRHNSNLNRIPYYHHDGTTPYLIVGGLVMQELTRPYLRSWGKNWLGDVPSAFSYLWVFKNFIPEKPERIIILNQVLADPINKGYESISNVIIKTVNSVPIHSLLDLENAFEKPVLKNNEFFAQIGLDYGEGMIILPMKELKKAHERIASSYGVYDKESFFAWKQ